MNRCRVSWRFLLLSAVGSTRAARRVAWFSFLVTGLGGVVEAQVPGDAPLLEQPFWDVDSIPVLLAPGAELKRRGIRIQRELQLLDPQFEFCSQSRGGGRHGTKVLVWRSRSYLRAAAKRY